MSIGGPGFAARAAIVLALLAAAPDRAAAGSGAAAPAPAAALPVATLRAGNHPGFGRLVIDLPEGATAEALPVGAPGPDQPKGPPATLRIRLDGALPGPPPPLPHNLAAITTQGGLVGLRIAPAATWHAIRLGRRLVIDIADPPSGPATQPAPAANAPPTVATARVAQGFSGPPPRPLPPAERPTPPAPVEAFTARATPTAAPTTAAAPPAAQPAPAPTGPAPLPAPLVPVQTAPAQPAPAPAPGARLLTDGRLALPFPRGTGAAAFARGPFTVVVFDQSAPLDPAAFAASPGLAGAQVRQLPAATLLTLPVPAAALRLAPVPGGWSLAVAPATTSTPEPSPIRPQPDAGRLLLAADNVGHVVAVPDPQTGTDLLVGTQTQPGQAVAIARRTPQFALLATIEGVAVEPLADAVTLRAAPPGFVLAAAPGRALALDAQESASVADAAHLTRRWELPDLPPPALVRRLQAALQAAAAAPPLARGAARLAAVQAQLALGLDAEAMALATLAAADDPQLAQAPDAAGLSALGTMLAGRPDQAAAIEDPRLSGTDEVAFWRAVRMAMQTEGSPAAAQVFAATLPLLLAYPPPLRARLLPLVAETLASGGERSAAHRLLDANKDDPSLGFARALLAIAEQQSAPALAQLDALARSPDRLLRERASVRAVELRLRLGGLDTAQAAAALERLVYAWRGDGRELALRERAADLRARAGQYRAALALLREAASPALAAAWPAEVPSLRARRQALFAEALAQDARTPLPPFELVALIEENPDLLPEGEAGRAVAVRLADRLVALDLPGRAVPLLHSLAAAAASGPVRAELGARLAALQLAQGDAAAALAALAATDAAALPPDLAERRIIVRARATAARGGIGDAVAALAGLDSDAAAAARADLLEAAKDWPAATAALAEHARRVVPPEGPLDTAAARTLLRLAAAAAQAGDEAVLDRLRDRDLPRFPPGELADMLRVLTAPPVQSLPDLPRAAQEAALARQLPLALNALAPAAAPR